MTQESIPTRDTSTTDPVVTGATDPTIPEETTEGTSSVTPSQQLWVTLDQSDADYAPGETVGITASNVSTGGSLEFSVGHVSAGADGILGTADDVISGDLTGTGTPWVVTDGGAGDLDGLVNGAIQTSWYVNADALNQAFVLSAIDQASGQVATASFTDAAPPDASGAAADLTKDLSAVPGGDPTHNIGGALFQVYHVKSDFGQSAGTGTFDTFVQVQGPNNPPTEQGYNYDRSGTYGDVLSPQYNENTSGEHNTALLLSEIPIVTINGVNYREFLLDSNEATGANKEFISLDSLQIFQETSGTLGVGHVSPGANTPFTPGSGFGVAGEHLVYNMDASGNVWVAMNSTLSSGSGDSDIRVLVPDSAFLHDAAHQYIYVYSAFGFQGGDWQTNSGFEEWGTNPAALITFDISGKKYTDANGDGLVVGDVGLGGITIYIEKDGIAGLTAGDKSTVTAADGSWSFTGLDSSYDGMKVFEVLPNGYVQTLGQAGYTIDGISGQDQTGLNFANFEKFDISGKKFTDANGDGQTVGDVGLGGVTIFIDKNGDGLNNDGAANQTVTAADGTWSFTGLDASYAGKTVYEVLPNGYVQTLGQAGYQIVGTSGNDQTGLNFANFEKFDISGKKFTDANGDGQTAGDVGLGGVTIFIDKNGDGLNNDGAANQTVTAADGTWSFTGLDASYAGKTVYEVLPNGYVQTLGQAGYQIVGTSGNDQTGMNFANFEKFDISGKKFTDANGDGQTVGDVGLGGVTIFIDKNGDGLNNDGAANQTVTAADGTWSFTGLDASYAGKTVYEVLPNGYVQTLGQAGYQIVGTSGNDQTGMNFANFEKFDISGKKFTDANGDGQTVGDVGLGGVTIFIDKNGDGLNNDGAANQTVTAADGTWSFTGLDASYAGKTVYEVLPNGYVQTLGQAGYQIVGTSGHDQTGLDFANFAKFGISGTKFTDANGDGQTVGDVGLGGVTIFIDKNGDGLNNDGAANQTLTAADGTWSFTGLDASYAGKTVYEVLPNGYVQTLGQAGYQIVGTSGSDQTGLNFANFEKFDISGTKFTDTNGDGQTAGDVGLGGVTIFIDKNGDGLNNDGAANQTVTAADGTWSFTGLDASYAGKTVYEVLPNGYVQTLGQAGYQIVGTSGHDQTGLDFANFAKFGISGTKFTDANGDGQTVGDVGLGGVTIFIDKNGDGLNNDGAANQTVTAADGTWSFTGLDASYAGKTVYEVLPNGYIQTLGQAGYVITGTSGQNQTGLNFANFEKFDISGTKFTDANGDGQTAGDVGLGGVTIFIDKNGDGLNNDGAANQTVTAADGTWSFTGLDASYAGKTVYEVLPNGYVQTLGQAGYQIVGTSGNDQTGLNFANFEKFDISGTKFTDANGDGQTAGDAGLGGVTIFIDKNGDGLNNDGAANQTVTAADGTWSFTGLDASYAGKKVYEVLPNGYVQTLGQAGYTIVGTSGNDQTGLNFANFEKFDISGKKFLDANGDGQTAGDAGLGGVTIFIDKNGDGLNNDGAANQTVTAADGTWSFTGLDASYAGKTVYEVLPNGYVQTLGQAGYQIVGTSGNDQTGLNFANFEKFDISGKKFLDANGDGLTTGDAGLGGITIYIEKDGIAGLTAGDVSTVTAADGTWSFQNLDASYAGKKVYEVLPNGYVQSLGQAGYTIVGTSGNDQTGMNFANFVPGSIHGFKFNDMDANGKFDGTDVAMAGITIQLKGDVDGNGTIDTLTTTTDANGFFAFVNLHPGTYTISELFTDGNSWAATVDHNNDGVGDATTTVTITSGQELVAVKGEAGQLDPLHSEVVVGNTLTFGNHELGAVGLTPGFWYNHLYVWDAPIIGADTSNGGVDGKGVSLASKLAAAGTIEKADIASLLPGNVDVDKDNHKDLIVTGSNGKTLVIEWDDAREIVGASNGTGGDKLGDFARYAITTLLNDVGVPDFNAPNGVLTDIADWC
ncbi:SdrD B-like domain-containing protein [Mesorhizobium sp. Pch-S]|uniref:beta strand repeat-containing protein n=1 Tax=Mesorhizobium sp. Pch-S TaxID=2082387 RepID=UPI001013B692|nr:SdrD B-like domain-containing protein [Mesorhizobium sp. Pch-S]QAZ42755.1 hypothetical protein C1M53_07040 [Mesorhizobium sp. Pch-S]